MMMGFSMASPVLLAFLLSLHLGTAICGSDIARSGCFQYSHKSLPWTSVQSYEFTSNSCFQWAVIFTTKRGKKVCTHPRGKWVQRYISLLKTQKQCDSAEFSSKDAWTPLLALQPSGEPAQSFPKPPWAWWGGEGVKGPSVLESYPGRRRDLSLEGGQGGGRRFDSQAKLVL
ncbi:C-C motif chemokine 26 [Sapajus apella]|uniref:C-C motif chemokine 26 n=1 Tax=Sapajus apella TaxID=9515 RepID=A0A6J3FYA1_SAPAP|nr:C-C motif chemokine 26 [Sapajus apella]